MSRWKKLPGPSLPTSLAFEGRRARRSRFWLSGDAIPSVPTKTEKMKKKKARKAAAKARKRKQR
ncbi:hypothetical protein ABE957_10385 [Halomonas sp. CS7]|uniref:Uncharacterized protein n=1 Tax=Halomonas pelophila TaxID=3151122 RepID=A0ABV1N5R7_9GAMM